MTFSRRVFIRGVPAAGASLWAASTHEALSAGSHTVRFTAAADLEPAERALHERYMSMALDIVEKDGGPFGAVIVNRTSGDVVCTGKNRHRDGNIFHAELVALDECSRVDPPVDWRNLALYTSGESCPMCASAEIWAGIPEVIYATSIRSLIAFGVSQIRLDSPTIAAAAPFYDGHIIGGVLAERADAFYKRWAKRPR
ncbi:MAG: nucleoside deaminase [Hyphomicrobiales bacterium]|nr:nucleoside deaminase [Hyphomicrobiales bacterium]